MSGFWTSFLPRRREKVDGPLPLQARVATLESEMLSMRESSERTYGTIRKLQGKVYRGVALGDTTEAAPAPPESPDPEVHQVIPLSKADLYRRASELRR